MARREHLGEVPSDAARAGIPGAERAVLWVGNHGAAAWAEKEVLRRDTRRRAVPAIDTEGSEAGIPLLGEIHALCAAAAREKRALIRTLVEIVDVGPDKVRSRHHELRLQRRGREPLLRLLDRGQQHFLDLVEHEGIEGTRLGRHLPLERGEVENRVEDPAHTDRAFIDDAPAVRRIGIAKERMDRRVLAREPDEAVRGELGGFPRGRQEVRDLHPSFEREMQREEHGEDRGAALRGLLDDPIELSEITGHGRVDRLQILPHPKIDRLAVGGEVPARDPLEEGGLPREGRRRLPGLIGRRPLLERGRP